jgi:hypothetical protein
MEWIANGQDAEGEADGVNANVDADALHIATFDPPTVIRLLAALTSKDEEVSQRDFLLAVMAACAERDWPPVNASEEAWAIERLEGALESVYEAPRKSDVRLALRALQSAEALALSLQGEVDRLRGALERIGRAADCGCWPCTGQCRSQESLATENDEIRELARAALSQSPLPDTSPGDEQGVRIGLAADYCRIIAKVDDLATARALALASLDVLTLPVSELEPDTAAAFEGVSAAQATSSEVERGWLIEEWASKTGTFRARWWSLEAGDDDVPGSWSADVNAALRFARERDAQAYIDDTGWTEAKPTEHMWPLAHQGVEK